MLRTLSTEALTVINSYLHLPFGDKNISCPYFNNRRSKVHGGLRVLVGKGTPEEIVDEATLFAFKHKVDLKKLSDEDLKKFLVDHNLGIDCSGLAYSILDTELKSQKKGSLKKHLKFPTKNFLRKFIIRLRTIENTGVQTFADEKNSTMIALKDIQPGDFIIFLNTMEKGFHHIVTIHAVEYENTSPKTLFYTHSLHWQKDGKYAHGVRQGSIEVTDFQAPLLNQKWTEGEKQAEENETYLHAQSAERLELRRLNF